MALIIALLIGAMFLINDVLGASQGGGLWSVLLAYRRAQASVPSIDVDEGALRSVFVALALASFAPLILLLKIDVSKRWPSSVIFAVAAVFGIGLNVFIDEEIVSADLVGFGYQRCPSHDRTVGSRKSTVHFDNYVHNPSLCPTSASALTPMRDPRTELPRLAAPIARASWFSDDDYPALARKQLLEGVTQIRFTIGTTGRVQNCVIVKSSGSPLLDNTTCGIFLTNARYWPERDGAGHPVTQLQDDRVKWVMPKD